MDPTTLGTTYENILLTLAAIALSQRSLDRNQSGNYCRKTQNRCHYLSRCPSRHRCRLRHCLHTVYLGDTPKILQKRLARFLPGLWSQSVSKYKALGPGLAWL